MDQNQEPAGSQFTGKPIFVEKIPIIGEVPMVFYIPDGDQRGDDDEKRKLRTIIEKYGGILSEFHECFTYQLEPISDPLTPKHYFQGDVYQARWITDSVKEGVLLNKDWYHSFNNQHDNCKRLGFGKQHVRYTITEAMKIFSIALQKQNKTKSKSASFWLDVERQQTLPKRSADSLRNFWKTVEKKGLENYMRGALEDNVWYCHAFCKIPKVQLICTIEEDTGGELEQELIRQAESAPQRTTHRQLTLDAKKKGSIYSLHDMGQQRGKQGNSNTVDDKVDLSTSEGQVKCGRQLTTIFNLLDHQKLAGKDQGEEELEDEDKEMEAAGNELKAKQQTQILQQSNRTVEDLRNQVSKSGFRILKAKADANEEQGKKDKKPKAQEHRHATRHQKREAALDREKDKEPEVEEPAPAKEEEVQIEPAEMSGREAFFALVGIKMMALSQKYNRNLEELHGLFYTVSCDWKKLELFLQADKNAPEQTEKLQWTVLEDLAVRDEKDSEAFKHVVHNKGFGEVMKRRRFLEVDA